MADHVFGIDLGTTYSAIAFTNDFGLPEVIRNREGEETTPSVVFFESDTNFVVGKEAKNEILLNPDTTVALIKRHMGTDFSLDFFGKSYRPETISALILRDLVDYAKENTGIDTDKVVITVPAYFGLADKEATRQAGQLAGLDVVGIVTEPVAAALSVGIALDESKTVFVYDLGGGTFDCTIMQLSPGTVEVVVIDGNRLLGGADWDARLFELLNTKFMTQAGLTEDPTADEDFAQKLMTQVEDTKKSLSRKDRVPVTLTFGDVIERIEVTRAEFEEATRTLVDETLSIIRRTLDAAQLKKPGLTVDEFLLVGGSSKMPMIPASLENELGWTLRRTDLDLAVAKGAAVYGQGSQQFAETTSDGAAPAGDAPITPGDAGDGGDNGDKRIILGGQSVEIKNVLSRGVGIQYVRANPAAENGFEEYVYFIAHANDTLPLVATDEPSTYSDGTTELPIHIFEQNSSVEDDAIGANKELTPESDAVLRNLPNLAAGSPIHLELRISAEGASSLAATDPSTGQRIDVPFSLSVMQKTDFEEAQQIVAGLTRRD